MQKNLHQLTNITQLRVTTLFEHWLETHNLKCSCDVCVIDIIAMALNNLPPMYWGIRLEKNQHIKEKRFVSKLPDELITQALESAITKIGQQPHHSPITC